MFERFTDRSRRVVVLAQEEARALGHGWIGTEHLLLGLIREGEGVAAGVLETMHISLDAVRGEIGRVVGRGEGAPEGHIPFTPRAKTVLELSLREALALKHNYIGTEHILLGMLREGQGLAAQVLVGQGADLTVARQHVIAAVGGRGGARARSRPYPEMGRWSVTPAAQMVAGQARRLAQGARVGSHHYLLGLLGEEESLAAKVLASLGVTREAVEAKLAELDTAGTTDESREEAGGRRLSLRADPERVVLELADPEWAARVLLAAGGGATRTVRGTDAEAAGVFPELYAALDHALVQLSRRLPPTAGFVPGAWDPDAHAAFLTVAASPEGPVARLAVSPGASAVEVRPWLRSFLADNRSSLAQMAPAGGARRLEVVVDRAGGGGWRVFSSGVGEGGPDDPPVEGGVDALIDTALEHLA